MSTRQLERLVERAERLKVQGKRIAERREEPVSNTDLSWLQGFRRTAYTMADVLYDIIKEPSWFWFLNDIGFVAHRLYYIAREGKGTKRKDLQLDEISKTYMKYIDEYYKEATGKERCTWLLDVQEPYTYSAIIDDLMACFNRGIEKLEEESKGWVFKGKSMWKI